MNPYYTAGMIIKNHVTDIKQETEEVYLPIRSIIRYNGLLRNASYVIPLKEVRCQFREVILTCSNKHSKVVICMAASSITQTFPGTVIPQLPLGKCTHTLMSNIMLA